jgi:hypothetical protein
MVKLELTADVNPLDVAVSVYVPALAIAHPENGAVPLAAATGLLAQLSVAPAGVVILRVIGAVLEAVLPKVSKTVTTGWVANATELTVLDGDAAKERRVGVPAVMVKVVLVAAVSEPPVARSV